MGKSTNSKYLLKLTLVATLGGLLFGYDTGVISGTVGSLDSFFVKQNLPTDFFAQRLCFQ